MRNAGGDDGDLPDEMDRFSHLRFGFDPLALDEDTADRLLSGSLHPADAPPAYGEVARVLQVAAAPVVLAGEAAAIEAMRAAVAESQPERRKNVLTKLLSAKAAAIAATGLISMTGAAAATGTLPEPAQHVAEHVASTVGVDLPAPPERPKVEDSKTELPSDPAAQPPVCPPDVKNHGQAVSAVAHSHGDVAAMAKSDCGKHEKADHPEPAQTEPARTEPARTEPAEREPEHTTPTTAKAPEVHHSTEPEHHEAPATTSTTEAEHHDAPTTTTSTTEVHSDRHEEPSTTSTTVKTEDHSGRK